MRKRFHFFRYYVHHLSLACEHFLISTKHKAEADENVVINQSTNSHVGLMILILQFILREMWMYEPNVVVVVLQSF